MLYAHTVPDASEDCWQPLGDHLQKVSELAAAFASEFGAGEWARIVGLVHDAGKASKAFQQRLRGSAKQVDHSSAGAQVLANTYGPVIKQLAYAVAGHHGGLPNGIEGGELSPLRERLEKPVEEFDDFFEIVDLPEAKEIEACAPGLLKGCANPDSLAFSFSFLLRMLFSCLVDADYLDTERVMDPARAALRTYGGLTLEQMKNALEAKMRSFDSQSPTPVNVARSEIRQACEDAAEKSPGFFTLTVPTGGGKTLSSLSFALRHALLHGKKRVVYAIPFTSIVEQTANVFKGIFGDDSVLEHHSNYEFKGESEDDSERFMTERLAMENWDAPLVVTTNVQLFESLYSNKTSRCRKNHNLANSVIILDEAQSIPDEYLKPCLAALEELSSHYSSTVVLCTATQPALDGLWEFGSEPVEIVPENVRHESLFDQRVSISSDGTRSPEELADLIASNDQVLCIVSTRKAASDLYGRLSDLGVEGIYHLSALMIPKHRSAVLATIRERLSEGLPCRVISTQLIEAGVDVDFPTVYREVAGIDSIKQAAGRCNREGKLPVGVVHVFDCPDFAVTGHTWLARMRLLGKETISLLDSPFGNEGVRQFFLSRYQVEDTDEKGIVRMFSDAQRFLGLNYPFEKCAYNFKFIDDSGASVFVPWDDEARELLEGIRSGNVDIRQARAIQGYSVSLPFYVLRKLESESAVVRYQNSPYLVLERFDDQLRFYSDEVGIVFEEGGALTL